jgi:8-hydroxy-5-deazaflavin:NADPH oxidoreductase
MGCPASAGAPAKPARCSGCHPSAGLISVAGFDPVRAGGVDATTEIEVYGALHQSGGLNGRTVEVQEARAALAAAGH